MTNTMRYTSTKNYANPSYFPSNSVCQYNQNSKMCWHDPELIRIYVILPDYDAPLTQSLYVPPPETSGLKSILGYLAKCPTEVEWIPLFLFHTQCLCVAQPPALPVYDTSLADEWTDFCGNCLRYLLFARITCQIAKIRPNTVAISQNPRKPMSRRANVKYTDGATDDWHQW